MFKINKAIILPISLIILLSISFCYWEEQEAIKTLNQDLPEGVRVEREIIGNCIIVNEINDFLFEAPSACREIEIIKYSTEKESKGYRFSSVNIKGDTEEDSVIAVVKFESKPGIDLATQAQLFFEAFELEGDFIESQVGDTKTVISKDVYGLMGIDASFFQNGDHTYLITCGSEDFIREIIINGTW